MAAITAEEIRTAMRIILTTGQSYRIMDTEYKFADIDTLREMERDATAAESSSTMFKPVRFVSTT